eukprot:11227675-Lingulodinium_polyedra.AAC.1
MRTAAIALRPGHAVLGSGVYDGPAEKEASTKRERVPIVESQWPKKMFHDVGGVGTRGLEPLLPLLR